MRKDHNEEVYQLKKQIALYKDILENISQGVYIADINENIVWINSVVEKMENIEQHEIIGQKESEIWPDLPDNGKASNAIRMGKVTPEEFLSYFSKNGKKLDMLHRSYPFFYNSKLEYIYDIAFYLGYSEQQFTKILEFRQKLLNIHGESKNNTSFTFYDFISQNSKVQKLIEIAQKVAQKNTSVMICGLTGTGKEIIAQGIHNHSIYREGKFVAVNCAAIPENLLEIMLFGSAKGAFTGALDKKGLIEEANGGTLFFDEINSLPLSIQGKLLRVLQEKKFSPIGSNKSIEAKCRIVSATNQDPWQLVDNGLLRQDLYFRLSAVTLEIPPLRDRKDDIPLLIKNIINTLNKQFNMEIEDVDPKCRKLFEQYNWPGNVRELVHVLEYMYSISGDREILSYADLPSYLKSFYHEKAVIPVYFNDKLSLPEILQEVETNLLEEALSRNNGNIAAAARDLNIHREAMHYRIKRYGINPLRFKKHI